jgi:hypothetical protein
MGSAHVFLAASAGSASGFRTKTLPLVPDFGRQSALVERVGDEAAQIRVHPSPLAEEDAAVRRNGRGTVEQVLKSR